jgi:cytosine/adenosine deaminase-related metal-dependent hydrolase
MQYVSGLVYDGDEGFFRGSLGFEDGVIKEIGHREEKRALAKGIVVPNFFDAHVHIGDSIIREEIRGTVEDVFGPKGIKVENLKAASEETIVESIKLTLKNMISNGVSGFCDFREGGLKGIGALYLALFSAQVRCVALGRPDENKFVDREVEAILKTADGIGASAMSDWDGDDLKSLADLTKRKDKMFALHASEVEREEMDRILDLKPDFLVHMTKASDKDLELCAEKKVPIVICPRSNSFFGELVDIPRMLDKGVRLMLGTDNVMLNSPSILREMEFAYRLSKLHGGLPCREIFGIGMNSRSFFGRTQKFEVGQRSDLMVLDSLGPMDGLEKDPYYHIVLRATEANIGFVCIGEHIHSKTNINKR